MRKWFCKSVFHCPWMYYGRMALIVASCIMIVSLALFLVQIRLGHEALSVLLRIAFVKTVIWLVLGSASVVLAKRNVNKLIRLKESGVCYDAHIDSLSLTAYPHPLRTITSYANCVYKDSSQCTQIVTSKIFLTNQADMIRKINVYENPHNSDDYVVELVSM